MTIEKEAREIVKKNMKESPDCSCGEDDLGCQVYDWVNEEAMLIKDIASALQKKQDRIAELESALKEIAEASTDFFEEEMEAQVINLKGIAKKAIGGGK